MADLRMLEHNYPRDSRTAFEDLCTLLFCAELGLSHGVNRRVNQRGIESDPVRINGMVYAYQAKYYDAATRLKDKKDELVKSIKVARAEGVTDLLFFVNKDLPDRNADGGETKFVRDLEAAAHGGAGAPEVRLH